MGDGAEAGRRVFSGPHPKRGGSPRGSIPAGNIAIPT